jgi:olfactory receptor
MQRANHSALTEFILIGFSTFPHLQLMFFMLFMLMYFFTLLGNLIIMATIRSEHSLHTSMYLFLCTLSITEILYTLAIILHMLANLLSTHHSISFLASIGFTHAFLLTVMGYDRYVDFFLPLHYNVLMSPHGCACLVDWSWVGGSVMGIVVTTAIFNPTFCGPNEIHHFACHLPPWLKLVCAKDVLLVAKVLGLVCILPHWVDSSSSFSPMPSL